MHTHGKDTNSITFFHETEVSISGSLRGNENIMALIREGTVGNTRHSPEGTARASVATGPPTVTEAGRCNKAICKHEIA